MGSESDLLGNTTDKSNPQLSEEQLILDSLLSKTQSSDYLITYTTFIQTDSTDPTAFGLSYKYNECKFA